MSKSDNFTVKLSEGGFGIGMLGISVFMLVVLIQTIFNKEPLWLMLLIFSPMIILGIWLMMVSKIFKVEVKGQIIKGRTSIGRKYSFNVSEIAKVEWDIRANETMYMENLTIYTVAGKKISVGNMMEGYDKMLKYIKENVDESKIHINEVYMQPEQKK